MYLIGLIWVAFLVFIPLQKDVLPRNAAGRVTFEERVAVADKDREILLQNALQYVSKVRKQSEPGARGWINPLEGTLRKEGSFYVYKNGLLTQQLHGEIRYTLRLAVEDEGYTYTYTDFSFQYYQKNRYGRYEPISGKTKALEEAHFAGYQELWQAHKSSTLQHIQNHIQALKTAMQQEPVGTRQYNEHFIDERN